MQEDITLTDTNGNLVLGTISIPEGVNHDYATPKQYSKMKKLVK